MAQQTGADLHLLCHKPVHMLSAKPDHWRKILLVITTYVLIFFLYHGNIMTSVGTISVMTNSTFGFVLNF